MDLKKKNTYRFMLLFTILILLSVNITTPCLIQAKEQIREQMSTDTTSFPDHEYVERLLRFANMPGFAVAIIKKDGSVDYYNYGETKIRTGEAPTKDTVFFAASLTKSVTATAIMQLWEQGKIDLDADVNNYLPFPLRHPDYPDIPITPRILLTHTSGLTNILWRTFLYFSVFHYPLNWYEYYLTPGNSFYHEDNWNEYPPGEGIYYTSLGYDLLGYMVERISGMPFEDYCKQYIFEPLGMDNTSLRLSEIPYDQLTTLYIYLLGFYVPIPYYEIHNDGSGGMSSTAEDMAHFLKMKMQNGSYEGTQILQPETVELMHTVQFPGLPSYDIYGDSRNYGLGWIIWPMDNQSNYSNMQGHFGNTPGGLSSMTVLNDTGVIFFGNEWTRVSYQQTAMMFMLRQYFHTKTKPLHSICLKIE